MAHRLKAEKREERGKEAAKKLRKNGYIPGIVYGAGEENTPIKLKSHDFNKFLASLKGESVVIDLIIDGKKKNAIIKEIARDPVTGNVLHVDFQILHRGEKVTLTVPVVLVGTAQGVKMGGILEQLLREIEIRAIPSKIPAHIEVDVSSLKVGESIHVRDLKLKDIEILEDPDEPIVTILMPKKGIEEEVVVEEEAAEEAEAEKPEEKEEEKEES